MAGYTTIVLSLVFVLTYTMASGVVQSSFLSARFDYVVASGKFAALANTNGYVRQISFQKLQK